MLIIEKLSIIQQYISWYGWPTCLFFGSIGCSLNIVLFSRQHFRTISCCLYFLAASVAMVISLCIGIIPYIYAFNNPNPYNTISSFCKARTYIAQSCVMMYRWLMVAACIDRYVHTIVSAYFQRLTHARVAFRIILVITIIWLILPFHQLVWIDVKGNACTYINISVRVYNSVFTIILGGLLPSLIMLIFTLLIQHSLALKRTRLFRLRNTLKQDRAQHLLRSRDQQACVMLFVQIFVYIITNLPWAIYLVYAASTSYMIKSVEHLAIDAFVKFLMEFILQIYPVVSFPMYTVASSTFRQELIKTLKSFLICRQQHLLL